MYLNLHHELGWQHQLDNVNRDMSLVLKGSNQHFTVSSVPASRNGAVVNVGADLFMSKNAKIYLDYSGSLSSNYQDNNVALGVNWTF
ncbi:autotransporter outer membrane beta-barrel domain-containing protein [Providencia stuartii]|uniref:autotransporter outer membrane beta-barrel domain-containing protein n=1 Tax=Providencia stuartii TaxID=588 RepID=UPI0030020BC7